MYVTDELRELILRRASEDELREAARRAGMRTLMEDGIAKAAQGLTTLKELGRASVRKKASR
jgi:type II secretory ATPase GspE/PulE/Tfp pilus assembly ATPase PilB-like protein